MKTNYTLGRSPENDIVIDAAIIGRQHLSIQYISENELLIEDLDSSNQTYVNNVRIRKKTISPVDEIRLGTHLLSNRFLFTEIMKKVNESKIDFSKEFEQLKKVYEEYEKKINDLKRKSLIVPTILKSGVTLCIMAAAYFIFENPQLRYPIMTGAGLVGGLITLGMQHDSKLKDHIDILTAELELVYKCPKCNKSLISRRWQHWAYKKECENCGAKLAN